MIRINLAPVRERKAFRISLPSFNLGILFALLSVLSVILIGGWWWVLASERDQLERDIVVAEKQLETLKAAIAEGNRYKAERDDLDRGLALPVVTLVVANDDDNPAADTHRAGGEVGRTRAERERVVRMAYTSRRVSLQLLRTNLPASAAEIRVFQHLVTNVRVSRRVYRTTYPGRFKDVDLVVARQDITKMPRLITFEVVCRFEI